MNDGLTRYRGANVLAVGAHPDDLEAGAGGTLARLARAGARVTMAVVSIPNQPEVRTREAKLGAERLGCALRLLTTDGRHVEDLKSYELVAALDGLVKELRPRLLISHALCDHHRDHVLAGTAALALQRLGHFDHWRYTNSPSATRAQPFQPSLYVDITPTIDAKLHAIGAHKSQFQGRGRDPGKFRDTAHELGRLAGVDYAEAFEIARFVFN